ncbi:MAG: anti-sigma regulatory factor [Oscillatoriales cyanobacterium CG2_30_44_21]|nr:MAG: anti-sigma regulatory factor [Oscillatoriales cyanobacterium CG2_30_44_21]
MIQKYQIQLNSDIYTLSKLQGWFQQFQNLLPKQAWMQCNLVLVEVFTNVVSYAHEKLPEETPIDIELNINTSERWLQLKIWDHGEPFDLSKEIERASMEVEKNKEFSNSPNNIDDLPTGGRGLHIAKTIADEINYDRIDERNCFVMIKKF